MSTKPHEIHVLGIETSCDDTGVAILRQDGKILSNCVYSQLKHHLSFGGILPMVARQFHVDHMDQVARLAFAESGLKSMANDISAIAVTTRPGINLSLEVGFNYAKQLAKKYSKPLIPIHHMQAHALMPLLENRCIKFPYLALLISGGHCLLSICERHNKFHLLGESRDIAPGELLDKVARRLRLKHLGPPYDEISGGAAIELLSRWEGANKFKYFNNELAVPMIRKANCNFSYSGYLGNFEKIVTEFDELWRTCDIDTLTQELSHLCASIQRLILVQLFKKLQRAMMYYRMHWRYNNQAAFHTSDNSPQSHLGFGIRNSGDESDHLDVVVSGGVAANSYIIETLRSTCHSDIDPTVNLFAPSKRLCSDNGLMIAWNGMLKYLHAASDTKSHSHDLHDTIIRYPSEMDLIQTIPTSPIGEDLIPLVEQANFRLPRARNPELKLMSPFSDKGEHQNGT